MGLKHPLRRIVAALSRRAVFAAAVLILGCCPRTYHVPEYAPELERARVTKVYALEKSLAKFRDTAAPEPNQALKIVRGDPRVIVAAPNAASFGPGGNAHAGTGSIVAVLADELSIAAVYTVYRTSKNLGRPGNKMFNDAVHSLASGADNTTLLVFARRGDMAADVAIRTGSTVVAVQQLADALATQFRRRGLQVAREEADPGFGGAAIRVLVNTSRLPTVENQGDPAARQRVSQLMGGLVSGLRPTARG